MLVICAWIFIEWIEMWIIVESLGQEGFSVDVRSGKPTGHSFSWKAHFFVGAQSNSMEIIKP